MIRRSKIKVRPAIRKPCGPAAVPTKPSCTISNKDCTSNNADKFLPQQITNGSNEILKQNSACESASAVKTLESEKNDSQEAIESKLDNRPNSEQKTKAYTPPAKVVPQKIRRRKLVACPLTAKERPRLNPPQTKRKAVEASHPEDPKPVSNALVEVDLQQNETISPQFLDHVLDPVQNVVSEIIVADAEPSEMTDTSQPKEHTSIQTVENAKDYNSDLPDHLNLEDNDNNPCNALNSNLDVDTNKLHRKDNFYVTQQVKKNSEKRRSSITTYRNKAKTKLRKLMNEQGSETNSWPEIDHNVISMSDLIYLNPPVNSGLVLGMNATKASTAENVSSPHPPSGVETVITPVCNTTETHSNLSTASEEPEALPVPQIRIAEDGSVVIDEESLVMEQKKTETVSRGEAVYEFGRETTVNQYSFRRRPLARSSKWSQAETDKFYRCLCIVGAEFSMMSAMFAKRSADDLRRKYRRERKIHPSRVDQAMKQQHLSKWSDDMFESKNISDKESDKSEKTDVT